MCCAAQCWQSILTLSTNDIWWREKDVQSLKVGDSVAQPRVNYSMQKRVSSSVYLYLYPSNRLWTGLTWVGWVTKKLLFCQAQSGLTIPQVAMVPSGELDGTVSGKHACPMNPYDWYLFAGPAPSEWKLFSCSWLSAANLEVLHLSDAADVLCAPNSRGPAPRPKSCWL